MVNDERCPKNPSMPKMYCSHCQGTDRGTHANPKFSTIDKNSNGFPLIEVLSNGGPIHEFDEHFQFGVKKAQLLLSSVDVFDTFWHATEEERRGFRAQIIEPRGPNAPSLVYVEPYKNFQRSSGEIIDHPWLKVEGIYPGEEARTYIGMGALKCRAICEVQVDIRLWLSRLGFAVG